MGTSGKEQGHTDDLGSSAGEEVSISLSLSIMFGSLSFYSSSNSYGDDP